MFQAELALVLRFAYEITKPFQNGNKEPFSAFPMYQFFLQRVGTKLR